MFAGALLATAAMFGIAMYTPLAGLIVIHKADVRLSACQSIHKNDEPNRRCQEIDVMTKTAREVVRDTYYK